MKKGTTRQLNWVRVDDVTWYTSCGTCEVRGFWTSVRTNFGSQRKLRYMATIKTKTRSFKREYSKPSSCRRWCQQMTRYQHQVINDPQDQRKDSNDVSAEQEKK